MTFKDYTGQTVGRLKFLEWKKENNKNFWKAVCQCGNEQWYRADYISKMKCIGSNFECYKCKWERKSPTLTDKVFGRLTVIDEVPKKGKDRRWLVRCECGVVKEIISSSLLNKKNPTRSCGCLCRKLHSKWVNTTQYPPAHQLRTKDTEEIEANLYHCRNAMVAGCYRKEDTRYVSHGALGHTVCELWRNGAKDFVKWALKNGYEKGDGIFLKPGKEEFSPKNCFIQSKAEFFKLHNSKQIYFNGKTQSITDWAHEFGCTISCLSQRLRKFSDYPLEKIMDLTWVPDKKNIYGTEHFEKPIIELYQQGKSFEEICSELGCSSSTIKRFLRKNDIKPRDALCRSAKTIKDQMPIVHEMKQQGKTFTEIASQLKIKYESMCYHYKNFLK